MKSRHVVTVSLAVTVCNGLVVTVNLLILLLATVVTVKRARVYARDIYPTP